MSEESLFVSCCGVPIGIFIIVAIIDIIINTILLITGVSFSYDYLKVFYYIFLACIAFLVCSTLDKLYI